MANLVNKFRCQLTGIYRLLIIAALAVTPFFSFQNAYADIDYGVGRTRTCDANGNPEGLDFNPTSGGKDIEFVMTNPVCLGIMTAVYASVKISIAAMNGACGSGSAVPRIKPSPIQDSIDVARAATKVTSAGPSCGAAMGAAGASLLSAIGYLAGTYGVATLVYNETKVCGANWVAPNPNDYTITTPNYKQTVKLAVEGYSRNDPSKLSLSSGDQKYREWYYGGVEVEDNPASGDACYDVTQRVNGEYPKQKYYMKGIETGNFNCKKYDLQPGQNDPLDNTPLTEQRLLDFKTAYNCCKKRSMQYICIDYSGNKKFCQTGTICEISGIYFSAKSLDNDRLACAESYSLCPYNFSVGGGSEYCDYYRDGKWDDAQQRWIMITTADTDAGNCSTKSEIRNADCTYNNKAGKCRNYCQYMRHCTKTGSADYHYQSSLVSPYFAMACLNFQGDSQNKTAFNSGFILGSQRHFSAPIAQCVKETLENVFYNRAGHSKCANFNELPSANGTCPSGQYATEGTFVHKMGNPVLTKSFFSMFQDAMQAIVKMVLTLSIMFYGMKILLGVSEIQKKELLPYILKIGLVLYFATGDAWQTMFFDGVYGVSSEFSRMVFKIQVEEAEIKRDGCQFGEITTPDGVTTSTGLTYPKGKSYLALWDTLDCKIMRYLGFGPEVSAANIASLIIAGYFTGAIGIYFAISVMFFGFFFIAATIRALHIFLSSCLSIIIMVFVSPIIIPLALFNKTNDIFKKWSTNLLSFCLQPMILFAYIAIFVIVLDKTMIGSAVFRGQPPMKTISCDEVCKDSNGSTVPFVGDEPPACDQPGQKKVDPMNDSVACLISINNFGKFPGLEIIGISVPILKNVFNNNAKEKILTILKGALVMYLLCKFMDEIPGITSRLIGGAALPTSGISSMKMFGATAGFLSALQKRATGAGRKMAGSAYERRKGLSEGVRKAGDKGKSADKMGESGADSVGKADGSSSADSAARTGGASSSAGKTGGGGDSGGKT